jgi:hypothetical protein
MFRRWWTIRNRRQQLTGAVSTGVFNTDSGGVFNVSSIGITGV